MKISGNKIGIYLTLLFLSSCELERDNPLDASNPNYNPKKEIKIKSHQVVCKYAAGAVDFSTETSIKAGDRIFLRINVMNTGQVSLSKIRTEITSLSGAIQIEPTRSNYYVRLWDGVVDQIDPGEAGFTDITNGTSFLFAPNYASYGIEFTVSNSAKVGDNVSLRMKSVDSQGQVWEENLSFVIN